MSRDTQKLLLDMAERAAWTFLQTFITLYLSPVIAYLQGDTATSQGVWELLSNLDTIQKAAVAAVAAVLSLVKSGTLGQLIGSPKTAATLPATKDPSL